MQETKSDHKVLCPILPEKGTYFSTGGANLPSRKQLLNQLKIIKTPIAQTDH